MKSGVYLGMFNTDNLTITPEMLNLTAAIDEFKGAWQALGTLAPERLSALRRVATIESVVLPGFPWVTPVRNWPGRGLDRHRRSRWLS